MPMIAFTDVHYFGTSARAAAVVSTGWACTEAHRTYKIQQQTPADYQAGQFYKRELPPLLAVLGEIEVPLDRVVIDGYCYLSDEDAPGLGWYLHDALGGRLPVVGVAKNRFRETDHAVEVTRGTSRNPLYVTAVGMDARQAADHVTTMAGDHRIPTLLKQVVRVARHGHG